MNLKSSLYLGLLLALPFSVGHAANSEYKVSVDHSDGVYSSGESAVFSLSREADAPVDGIQYRIWKNRWDTILTEPLNSQQLTEDIAFTPPENGWFRCTVLRPTGRRTAAESGVVFAPDSFRPTLPIPDDFDAFWDGQKKRLKAAPAEPIITPLSPEQLAVETTNKDHKKKIARIAEHFTYDNLEIPCLDVNPVRGYYSKPKEAAPGSHPAIILFHAAGVDGGWCRSSLVQTLAAAEKYDAIVLDMNAHGMLNGQSQDYYDALAKGELKDYQLQGQQSRDEFYFLGMFLRLMRAIDFLCEQPEWDGRNVICYGISQGGAQVMAASGLDERVSTAVAIVPGMCNIADDVSGWPGLGKIKAGTPEAEAAANTMRYFDATNFASRSKADTLISVGLVDMTCPPPGVYAAYNQLTTPKRIISVPNQGHHQMSVPNSTLRKEYEQFILSHLRE